MENIDKTRAARWLSGGTVYDKPASPDKNYKGPKG